MPHATYHLEETDEPGTAAPEPVRKPNPKPTPPPRPEIEPPPARVRRPRVRRDVGTAWLILLGLLLVAAIPLLIDLSRPGQFTHDEERAVGTAIETWQRRQDFKGSDEALEPWVPVDLGRLRYDQPPGAAWLHVVAISLGQGQPVNNSAQTDVRRATVLMTLLLIGSVFWAGHNIGGLLTGALSALIAMTMPALLFFGRIAVPDVPIAAWSALAMAAALWAMRPLRRNPSLLRQFLGWLVCGAALGAVMLTGGPIAVPIAAIPILVIAMLCPYRVGHTLGLLASVAVAALVVTPWAIYVHESTPDGWQHWLSTLSPRAGGTTLLGYLVTVLWRTLAMTVLTGVWIVWIIPALLLAFSPSTGEPRRRLLLGTAWMISAGVLLAFAPGPARYGALLGVIAPASLALGQLMRHFHNLSGEGRHAHLWTSCKWVAIGLTALLSLALPILGWLGQDLPDWWPAFSSTGAPLFASMHIGYWLGLAAVLGLLAALAARFAIANHPGRAVAAWAGWTLAAAAVLAIPLARGPALNTPATAALPASATP
ncbi:phospholipid carrier-dependent glycosyltransferase [Phycisphaeraceae bacterium D3-23]